MPRYGDDQCEECGGIRVAKSFLCADCLVKACARERQKTHVLQSLIDNRDLDIAKIRRRLEGALAYGFKQDRMVVTLEGMVRELRKMVQKGG